MKLHLEPVDLAAIHYTILRWCRNHGIGFESLVEGMAHSQHLTFLDCTSTDNALRMQKNTSSMRNRLCGAVPVYEDFFPALSVSLPESLRVEVWDQVSDVICDAGMQVSPTHKVVDDTTKAHSKETADLHSLLPRINANLNSNDLSYLIQIRKEAVEVLAAAETLVHKLNDRIESRKTEQETEAL